MLFFAACFLGALILGVPWCISRMYYRHDRTLNTTKYVYFWYLAFFFVLIGIVVPIVRKVWLYLRISKRSPLDGLATIGLFVFSSVPLAVLTVTTLVLLRKKCFDVYKVFHFSVGVSIILLGSRVRYRGEIDDSAPIKIGNHTSFYDYLFASHAMGSKPWNIVAGINLRKNKPTVWDRCIAASIGKIVEEYSISIDRSDKESRISVSRQMINELDAGKNVMIFPEGTRTLKEAIRQRILLQKFHDGPFRIAWSTGRSIQPIVFDWPVMLRGKGDDWWGLHPGVIDATYLPVFDPKDYASAEELKNACWKAMHDVLLNSKKVQTFLKQM